MWHNSFMNNSPPKIPVVETSFTTGRVQSSKLERPIMFCGGGTLGAVVPLLAVVEELKKISPDTKIVWVGSENEIVKNAVLSCGLNYEVLPTVKVDRFWSWQNLTMPFRFLKVLFLSLRFVEKYFPAVIINAGSFTGVPIIWLGKFFGAKIVIHQQDRVPSLSNSLTVYLANEITVSFPDQKHIFQPKIARYIGNPVRASLLKKYSNLPPTTYNLPTVLIMGGSSGALGLNEKIKECLSELLKKYKVVHLTGAGKGLDFNKDNYEQHEFSFDKMAKFYAEASLVISRCGLNAISELSALKKPTIFVPLPDSHQEANATWLAENGALVLKQKEITPEILNAKIDEAWAQNNPAWWNFYQPDAAHNLAKIILDDK